MHTTQRRRDRSESRRAIIAMKNRPFKTYSEHKKRLEDDKSKGDGADGFMVAGLRKKLKKTQEVLLKEADRDFQ